MAFVVTFFFFAALGGTIIGTIIGVLIGLFVVLCQVLVWIVGAIFKRLA